MLVRALVLRCPHLPSLYVLGVSVFLLGCRALGGAEMQNSSGQGQDRHT